MESFDVVIIGAGAAGLMCAIQAGRRGKKTLVLERSPEIGRKILVSGGGRCNFTNTGVVPERYISANPHFAVSALSRFTPDNFLALVRSHKIPFHEKKLGQLFCDSSARDIVQLLLAECEKAGVKIDLGCSIESVEKKSEGFTVATNKDIFGAPALVIATGGLSLPKTGATDFGYRLAQQFGLSIVETAPALDGFRFGPKERAAFEGLSGVSIDSEVSSGGASFRENILFTHSGMSGPAALQASLYWRPGGAVRVNFLPERSPSELAGWWLEKKQSGTRTEIKNLLPELGLPKSFSEKFWLSELPEQKLLSQLPDKTVEAFARRLQQWEFVPEGTIGYQRAEVTRGGVDTNELSSKTMESKKVPGLYFIGEVVDVTGWLGGYNFQWAWASGSAAGQAV